MEVVERDVEERDVEERGVEERGVEELLGSGGLHEEDRLAGQADAGGGQREGLHLSRR